MRSKWIVFPCIINNNVTVVASTAMYKPFLPVFLLFLWCGTHSVVCDEGSIYCRDKTIGQLGDLNIAFLINLFHSSDGQLCDGGVSISGFQTAVAVEWIMDILNNTVSENSTVKPEMDLGYTIFDDCGLSSRTSSLMTAIFHHTSLSQIRECSSQKAEPKYNAVVTMTSPESFAAAADMTPTGTPVVTVNHHLDSYADWPNLFFGKVQVEEEINIILEFMQYQTWNFVAVVYTQDTTGLDYLHALEVKSKERGNCYRHYPIDGTRQNISNVVQNKIFSDQINYAESDTFGVLYLGKKDEALTFLDVIKSSQRISATKLMILVPVSVGEGIQFTNLSISNSIYLITPHTVLFRGFQTYLNGVIDKHFNGQSSHLDPWISKYINAVCHTFGKDNCSSKDIASAFVQESAVYKVVTIVLSISKSLKEMQEKYCREQETGNCSTFQNNLNKLSDFLFRSFTIDPSMTSVLGTTEPLVLGFNHSNVLSGGSYYSIIYIKDQTRKLIGNYSTQTRRLVIDEQFMTPPSICKVKSQCKMCIDNEELKFGYIHGDTLLLGLFSIHQDSQDNLFQCGNFRSASNAIVTVSAFLQSVKTLRRDTGIKFGAVALDDCYNELNITDLLLQLFSKTRVVYDPDTHLAINFDNVVAVIGALSSRVTQPVADIMTSLHIPMISYGASATTLDNRIRYPYFSRTVPSDSLQIDGMVKLMSTLKIKYGGAMYIDDAYGASGIEGIKIKSAMNGICILEPKSTTEDTTEDKLKQNLKRYQFNEYGQAQVVVLFSIDSIVNKIIGPKVLGDDTDDELASYAPIFIASEGWGTDLKLANKESIGSLIFTTDSLKGVSTSFRDYLRSLTVSSETENPWLFRYFEEQLNCYMPRSFDKFNSVACSPNAKLNNSTTQSLFNEQRNVHTEIAVQAIGQAYESFCRNRLCFERNKNSGTRWSGAIRNASIKIDDRTWYRPFRNDGNGNLGFTIYNIQKQSSSNYSYVKVGTYNGSLMLQPTNIKFYNPVGLEIVLPSIQCPTKACPDVCAPTTLPPETSTARIVVSEEQTSDTWLIVLGAVTGALFLLVILLTCLVFRALRNNSEYIKKESSFNHHLTVPVPAHHRSNRSVDGIYHEPHSSHSSINNLNVSSRNEAFQCDNESNINQSSSSRIVPGSTSGSPGSHVNYSDKSQTHLKPFDTNKYLSFDSPVGSNESLKDLTRRVLQPERQGIKDENPNDDTKITYLSANDLVMSEEENELKQNSPKIHNFNDISPLAVTPMGPNDVLVPPAYKDQSKRPQTLPGVQPLHLSPNKGPTTSTGYPSPERQTNLYPNDMYLIPIADTLPTYQEHLKLQQNYNKEDPKANGKISSPIQRTPGQQLVHPMQNGGISKATSPNDETTFYKQGYSLSQNGGISKATSPNDETKFYKQGYSLSPSPSSFGSQSASMESLSPVQKEALLKRMLHENPSYFLNQYNQSKHSPTKTPTTPNDKFKMQVLNALSDTPKGQEAIDVDETEEFII